MVYFLQILAIILFIEYCECNSKTSIITDFQMSFIVLLLVVKTDDSLVAKLCFYVTFDKLRTL